MDFFLRTPCWLDYGLSRYTSQNLPAPRDGAGAPDISEPFQRTSIRRSTNRRSVWPDWGCSGVGPSGRLLHTTPSARRSRQHRIAQLFLLWAGARRFLCCYIWRPGDPIKWDSETSSFGVYKDLLCRLRLDSFSEGFYGLYGNPDMAIYGFFVSTTSMRTAVATWVLRYCDLLLL